MKAGACWFFLSWVFNIELTVVDISDLGKGGLKGLRFVPGLGLIVTAGFAGYGIYDAIKKGYMSPEDLLASAVWGSGVDIGPKNKVKTENEESVAS